MSQPAPWNVPSSQPLPGGVKMFDPTQFSASTPAAASPQPNFTVNSSTAPTQAYNSYGTDNQQQFMPNNTYDASQNNQTQNLQQTNAWTSWGSWGEGDQNTGLPQPAHTPGEASGGVPVYNSQQHEEHGQWYWDPNSQQHVQYGQQNQPQQWQGYQQDQNINLPTSEHNVYNNYQYQNTQAADGSTQVFNPQQDPNNDQYSQQQQYIDNSQYNTQPSITDSFLPPNDSLAVIPNPPSEQNYETSQNLEQVTDSNSVNSYFNSDSTHNTSNVPFSTSEVTNQFPHVISNVHQNDPDMYSKQQLVTDGSQNSMNQDQSIQQVTGQFQSVSLDPQPLESSNVAQVTQNASSVPQYSGEQPQSQGISPEDDHQSPLNDWEFVNSIPSSSSQHSRQSSLENSANIVTPSQASPGSQSVPQTTSEMVDPYNVNISASSTSEASSSMLSSETTTQSSSEPSSLGASFNNPLNSDSPLQTSPHQASLLPPPPGALQTAGASNPFRRASPKVPTVNTDKDISAPQTVIPAPIFHPITLSPAKPSFEPTQVDTTNQLNDLSSSVSTHTETQLARSPALTQLSDKPKTNEHPTTDLKQSDSNPISEVPKEVEPKETNPLPSDNFRLPPKPTTREIPREIPHSSPRKHNSAFKPIHRAKHNMSPAATLWDDLAPPQIPGMLLAPAAPSVTEASVLKSTTSSPTKSSTKDSKTEERRNKDGRVLSDSEGFSDNAKSNYRERRLGSTKKDDDNRSLDSLDEVNSKMDSYQGRRYRDRYTARDQYYEKDRPVSRSEYRDDYKSRYSSRDNSYYRSYDRDPYYNNERYERPRSRNNESLERELDPVDRPRSRATGDYDREAYYRDRYRGYSYDPRRRYDDRASYELDYLYSQGYYDEYYGHQGYSGRYADYYRQYGGEADRYSHISYSPRANTPALDETDASYDNQGRLSRPSSRQGQEYDDSAYRHDAYDPRYASHYGYYGYDQYNQGYGYDPYAGYQDTSYQRLTPPKHSIPHLKACFGVNGQLIKILPNRPADGQPAVVELQEIEGLLSDTKGAEEFKEFPGPLIRVDTHKNDVLLFCQRKAKKCSEDINMIDRESAELIWRLLELLIKQNGTVIGTDIAELLLEGHEPTTYEYSMTGMKISTSLDNLEETADDSKVTADKTVITKQKSRDDLIDRFRHLLLYGRKKDALDWAMKNNIWGHALFLASKMDTRTHANVMTKFANSAMKMNDPLQSLYQLMSGRQPAAVTCMSDERWGDWRPHLAMILSNHTSKSDIDRKSIATLGDTLAAKGCLHASHFCYLMAQVHFGLFTKKTSKIVLIGSSHNLSLEEFATTEAIQCTEIYEYAQSLGNSSFVLPQLQIFKFLYACRLAEFGLSEEALRYCEVISQNVQHSPVYYQPAFVKSLYELSNRLKYYDPARQHESEDSSDPAWLQHLAVVCNGYDDGSIQPISGTATPAGYGGTTTSSDSGEVAEYTSNNNYTASQYQTYQQDGTYTDPNYQQQYDQGQMQQGQGQYDQSQGYYHQGQEQYQSQYQQTGDGNQETTEVQNADYLQQLQQYNAEWNQYAQQKGYATDANQQTTTDVTNTNHAYNTANQNAAYGAGQTGYYQQTNAENQQQQQYYQQQARNSITSAQSQNTEDEDDEDEEDVIDNDVMGQSGSSFDYFGSVSSQPIVAPPSRFRTNSTSSTNSHPPPRQRTTSGSSTGSLSAANPKPKPKEHVQKKEQPKKNDKGGGWSITGMFGWGKNNNGNKHKEMKLPDDKDPQIVWDPVLKKWANPDAEETSGPAAPPPKDTDLMGKSSTMNGSAPPMMSNSTSTNRFSLKSAGGARNQYVDVLKSSSSPVPPTNLLNTAPNTNSTNTNIYNPLGAPASSAQSSQAPSGSENKHLDIPQTSQNISRSSSRSSLSREVEEINDQTGQVSNQKTSVPGMPVLFDPTQFSQTAQPKTEIKSGMKYGQRRKYPK